jgi:hypothetical protein
MQGYGSDEESHGTVPPLSDNMIPSVVTDPGDQTDADELRSYQCGVTWPFTEYRAGLYTAAAQSVLGAGVVCNLGSDSECLEGSVCSCVRLFGSETFFDGGTSGQEEEKNEDRDKGFFHRRALLV